MKKIGLLGGTSFPSTITYYTRLNQLVNQRLGGHHSCRMILYSIDYHEIKSRYSNGWGEIPTLLRKEIEALLEMKPDCLLICNNTLHKAFDLIKDEMEINIPVLHIMELTIQHLRERKLNRVLLLGTRFTMEDTYFTQPLREAGIEVGVPELTDRIRIQEIQSELSKGNSAPEFAAYFQELVNKSNNYEGVILGCTELPAVFCQVSTNMAVIDTIELQCQQAVEFVLPPQQKAVTGELKSLKWL